MDRRGARWSSLLLGLAVLVSGCGSAPTLSHTLSRVKTPAGVAVSWAEAVLGGRDRTMTRHSCATSRAVDQARLLAVAAPGAEVHAGGTATDRSSWTVTLIVVAKSHPAASVPVRVIAHGAGFIVC